MTNISLTPAVALTRLRRYEERTSTWSTASCNDGTEKALHQIAVTLAVEVERLRKALPDISEQQEIVAQAIRDFRFHNYGLDNVDPNSEYAEWVGDLASAIVRALSAEETTP
ncbi:hypothetical protein [Streptomyces sp. NRRL F-5135]|uniref:hypothetical protein n=1 Tax=Streptomyces sp. NRRL F-5135 TaxID=1463858 RepID=UPI0004C58DA0|nr:hypothetical protein [Streptomyces sp. NRRL F-5135]